MEQPGLLHNQLQDLVPYVRIGYAHRKHLIGTAAQTVRVESRLDDMFHLVQTYAQTEYLQEPLHPADDVVAAVRVPAGYVARMQDSVVLVPPHQVLWTGGVAQGDILPPVDHLSRCLTVEGLRSAVVHYGKLSARLRNADAAGLRQGQFRGQVCHAGGTLGLTVGGDELLSRPVRILCAGTEQLVAHPTAALGDDSEVRQVHAEETHLGQYLETVRHAGEDGRALLPEHAPEPLVQHGLAAQQEGRPAVQMARNH